MVLFHSLKRIEIFLRVAAPPAARCFSSGALTFSADCLIVIIRDSTIQSARVLCGSLSPYT